MIAMYWKFGTRGRGVSVGVMLGEGVKVGEGVNVGRIGVGVAVAVGVGDATLGGAEVAQAVNKMNK